MIPVFMAYDGNGSELLYAVGLSQVDEAFLRPVPGGKVGMGAKGQRFQMYGKEW